MTRRRQFLGLLLFLLLSALYLYGAARQGALVNLDPTEYDQGVFLSRTRALAEGGLRQPGNRNQMPIYSLLILLVYRPGIDDATFFLRAKLFNIALSYICLLGLGALFHRYLPLITWYSWIALPNLLLLAHYLPCMFKDV